MRCTVLKTALFSAVASAAIAQTSAPGTADFDATVTSFRNGQQGVYKVVTATVRFRNKTGQPLTLAYVPNTGVATDERGNRYQVYGRNPVRGIGVVSGTNFDPMMTLPPGGWADAAFDLMWRPGSNTVPGSAFVLDLTVDEITRTSGAYTRAGQMPLHFERLAASALASPCVPSRGATQSAAALSNAANAIGSIFSRGQAGRTASQVGTANTVCDTASSVAVARPPSTPMPPATVAAAAAPAPDPRPSMDGGAGGPPQSGTGSFGKIPDFKSMPDILGVHLGMPAAAAYAAIQHALPKERVVVLPASLKYMGQLGTSKQPVPGNLTVNYSQQAYEQVHAELTFPPEPQVVWRVYREKPSQHVNRGTLFGALREKYGKEDLALDYGHQITRDDTRIREMWWLFDEAGHRAPMPRSGPDTVIACEAEPLGGGLIGQAVEGTEHEKLEHGLSPWCASSGVFLKVVLTGADDEIVDRTDAYLIDIPLGIRSMHSTAAWWRSTLEKARQQDVDRSKQAKPAL